MELIREEPWVILDSLKIGSVDGQDNIDLECSSRVSTWHAYRSPRGLSSIPHLVRGKNARMQIFYSCLKMPKQSEDEFK